MAGRLDGKVAVITGAGSGIGKATAARFVAEGAAVVIGDVRGDAAADAAAELSGDGGRAAGRQLDVSSSAEVDALVAMAVERFGRIDIMMNNAAMPHGALLAETSDEDWRRVMSVTLDGVFYGTRAALRRMNAQGSGSIINVSSGAGLGGEVMLGAYGAAKAAVINLTKTAAVENAALGVRVNVICPGPIATPPLAAWLQYIPGGEEAFARQIPARRIGKPEEIAAVAVFLASDEASYVTGAVLVADGAVNARTATPRFD
ncbi:MAG TPA: SDR family oxidoreductase [Candidatus Binatia bacterium]|nr:SDR family oxidoreductase [Candidatus Binatia bacterium]